MSSGEHASGRHARAVTDGVERGASGSPRPPRWLFHSIVTAAAGCLLWTFSGPGFDFLLGQGALVMLAGAAVIWVVWLPLFLWRRRRWSWWFAVAPTGGVLVVALLLGEVPLQLRWAASQGAFQDVVADLPAEPAETAEWPPLEVPARLGSYRILGADRVPGGVIFYEAHGHVFDDAGFAYLPDGPKASLENGSFERPRFRHLGGAWYAWTASW